MTTGNFTPTERMLLVSAPQLIRHLVTIADRGAVLSVLAEAKAIKEFMSSYQSQSPLVQTIIAGQKDVDEKVQLSAEQAQKVLEQVGAALEAKTDEAGGDAVRDFLMGAAEAVAKAVREQGGTASPGASPSEQKTLVVIATALKATETDKRRRHTVAMNAAAIKQVEEQRAKAEAEAQKKAEEAKAEAQRKAELARQHAGQMAQSREEEAQKEREAQQKAEQARRLEEAKAKAELARQQREESARQHAEKAEEAKALSEAEVLKQKAEAMKREAEAMERQAEALKAAAQEPAGAAETIYVVKPGDTLSGIAKAVYGTAGRWREIFEANRDIINNPNLIRPGWKLRIPR